MSHTTSHAVGADKAKLELLIALLAADWLRGDRSHADAIREHTMKLLTDLGAEGAEAKDRLSGMP